MRRFLTMLILSWATAALFVVFAIMAAFDLSSPVRSAIGALAVVLSVVLVVKFWGITRDLTRETEDQREEHARIADDWIKRETEGKSHE